MHCIFKGRSFTVLGLMLVLTGCYSFIGEYGDPFYKGTENRYFERLIDACNDSLEEAFTYKLARDEELRIIDDDMNSKNVCLDTLVLLRFVWFSDVQLRQREVKLFNKRVSYHLDDVIPTFEYNEVQEDFDWAVYLSLIAATNRLHEVYPIDFMIHTGDAIDAGTIEELYQFVYITDKLNVPWLNLVGNHDASIFGNYKERLGYTRQAAVNFYPVGSLTNFLWMHRKDRIFSGFGSHLLPVPAPPHGDRQSVDGNRKIPGTSCHGFDLRVGMGDGSSMSNIDCSQLPGYYAFDIRGNVPIRVIVLNSAKLETWGADGEIDREQRGWLKEMLEGGQDRLSLVFCHHRPDDFDDETMAILNSCRTGEMVLFSGHKHKHHLKLHEGRGGQRFYELNTGSILEYPQIGRLIEIRGIPGNRGCLVSRALWSSHLELDPYIHREDLKKVLKECEDDRYHYRKPLSKAARCGHYGALEDYLKNMEQDCSADDKPQPFKEAWRAANIVIPVTIPQPKR